MKPKEMLRIEKHFSKYFEQKDCKVLHSVVEGPNHVDVLLYEPNSKYPFWKLATMGASDYQMPDNGHVISRYNEYVMFVDSGEDLNDKNVLNWYYSKLMMVATYAYNNKTGISYAHSMEWENEDADDEMIGAFIEFPQVIESVGILRCRLNVFKTVACLQVVLLNRTDLNKLANVGPQEFSEYLYPEVNFKKRHFLSERHRSDKF